VEVKQGVKRTPLYAAVAGGHAEVVSALLAAGADANADVEVEVEEEVELKEVNSYKSSTSMSTKIVKRTLMYAAVAGGHADVVSVLLAAGADANAKAGEEVKLKIYRYPEQGKATKIVQRTMLFFAAAGGHAEVTSTLLQAGADAAVDIVDEMTPKEIAGFPGTTPKIVKRTLISIAAAGGHTGVVDVLLAADGATGSAKGKVNKGKGKGRAKGGGEGGSAALVSACRGGHLEVVAQLLAAGVDANAKCDGGGLPTLGDEVRIVVGKGAGSFATVTASSWRSCRSSWTGYGFKLEGASCGSDDYKAGQIVLQVAPLHVAMMVSRGSHGQYKVGAGGFVDVALALLEAGATVGGKAGAALLVSACNLGSAELVAQLLAAGADAKLQDPMLNSALYVAVLSSSEVMALLLAAGADPDFGGPLARAIAIASDMGLRCRLGLSHIGYMNVDKVNQLLEAGARLNDLAVSTKPLIKAVLKLRGLKMGGAKHEMLERLRNSYAQKET
jgi:ankyrin repeat protein